jgi:hypothetical protein
LSSAHAFVIIDRYLDLNFEDYFFMAESTQLDFTPAELDQILQLRASILDFREIIASLPAGLRRAEYNEQFNQLRLEARPWLNGHFTSNVPRAITGDISTDRSLFVMATLGVIMALTGLGVNSIILDDVIFNSVGFCVYGAGMLFVIGAFGVLITRHLRERVSNIEDLRRHCDLLLYQIDHRLKMFESEVM